MLCRAIPWRCLEHHAGVYGQGMIETEWGLDIPRGRPPLVALKAATPARA
ncbi:hypothetical protein [Allorhizocola rhizosphaerae]|nr:hypothetical protein [Allorhizocola rhizosphaerae]